MMIYFLLDSDDENENYPYQLIEFIKKGRPSTKEIELVPTSWIKFESGVIKCLYPEGPYTEEVLEEVRRAIKNQLDPQGNVRAYSCRLKGIASM